MTVFNLFLSSEWEIQVHEHILETKEKEVDLGLEIWITRKENNKEGTYSISSVVQLSNSDRVIKSLNFIFKMYSSLPKSYRAVDKKIYINKNQKLLLNPNTH